MTDTVAAQVVPSDIFCSGHAFLDDGRVFVAGGTFPPFFGRTTTWLFDPPARTWQAGPEMNDGRYYPTNLTQGDGRILVFAGVDENGQRNPEVEQYDPGTGDLDVLEGADNPIDPYPAMHLLLGGSVFHSGPDRKTETFDPNTGSWTFVANTNFGDRGEHFCGVTLPPGHERILIFGGDLPGGGEDGVATDTAEIIDLSSQSPSWSYTAPMHFPRRNANAVILPDGKVLAVGGGYSSRVPTYPAEVFDPQSETWTVVATMRGFRLYHSAAVLLPDGRVLITGGLANVTANAELYKPWYFFKGPRPVISSAPADVGYGDAFAIDTPDADRITSVVLIRPGAATHAKNMTQQYLPVSFAIAPGQIDATAPSEPNEAPPGYYMLFLVDGDGIPSEAEMLRLH